jgi:hypothetical protein
MLHFLYRILSQSIVLFITLQERNSVNKSQMHIKRKTCDIRTWQKHLFLDISSTNIDTLVPSLCLCVETRSIEIFLLLSQPLPHLRFVICNFRMSLREFFDPVVNRFMRQTLPTVNRKHFSMNILRIKSFCPQKERTTELWFSVVHS